MIAKAASATAWLLLLFVAFESDVTRAAECPAGFDCVFEQIQTAFEDAGVNSTISCSDDSFAGFQCDGRTITICPAGFYCPTVLTDSALPCTAGFWCPQATSHPIECEPGASCPLGSRKQRIWVPFIVLVLAAATALAAFIFREFYPNQWARFSQTICGSCGSSESASESAFTAATTVTALPPNAAADRPAVRSVLPEGSLSGGGDEMSFIMSNGLRTEIIFRDVSIEVPITGGGGGSGGGGRAPTHRTVLHHMTGTFRAGRLSAIMGPSGSGKSTAMNALTGRIPLAGGSVLLNGCMPVSQLDKLIGFVGQEDIMFPIMTVRQVLVDSAFARLPQTWTQARKLALVEDVMEVLHLKHIAESIIGDAQLRGISGGEKKRVSVGMELVADPCILFLDEPTSGLDSTSAHDLVTALHRVAERGLIVIAVIHQPRAEIFAAIDDLLLLRTGGHVVYCGEAAAAAPYLAYLGFPLPPNTATADHLLDVMSGRVAPSRGLMSAPAAAVPMRLSEAWADFRRAHAAAGIEIDSSVKCTQKIVEGWSDPSRRIFATPTNERNRVTIHITSAGSTGSTGSVGSAGSVGSIGSVVEAGAVSKPDMKANSIAVASAGATAASKTVTIPNQTDAAILNDLVLTRSPPGFWYQFWLYFRRRIVLDGLQMYSIALDIGLQLLTGMLMSISSVNKEYYAPPLPLAVADTCPEIIRERCTSNAIFGVQSLASTAFFITIVVVCGSINFSTRTFAKWMQIHFRERLCGRNLYAYYAAQCVYDLIHITRSASFFAGIFLPIISMRGGYAYWWLLFWLMIFASYGMGYSVSIIFGWELATCTVPPPLLPSSCRAFASYAYTSRVAVAVVIGISAGITTGLAPRLDVVANWWPLPIFWSLSYNRWGAEAIINLATRSDVSAPLERVDAAIKAMGYEPANFPTDLAMLFVVGVLWRLLAFWRLKVARPAV